MRKTFLFSSIIFIFLFASSAFCQEKSPDLSLKIYGGYGFLTAAGQNFTITGDTHSDNTTAYTRTKEGLGQGLHAGMGLSLKINKFISVGIDADYLTGKKNTPQNLPADTLTGNYTSNHSVLSIIPNISFTLLSKPKYTIYNTIGIIEAVQTKFNYGYTTMRVSNQTTFTSNSTYKDKYGLNTGFRDNIGIQLNITKHIKGFVELTGYFLSVKPTSAAITSNYNALTNGQGSYETINYNITYKNSADFNFQHSELISGNTVSATNSYNTPPPVQHIYSGGINAGIIIDLEK
jgi:hypothetical protein